MKKFLDLNIQTKILVGFTLSFVIFAAVGLLLLSILGSTAQRFDSIATQYLPVNATLKAINISSLEVLSSTIEIVLLNTIDSEEDELKGEVDQWEEARDRLTDSLNAYARYVADIFPQERPRLEQLQTIISRFLDISDQIVLLSEDASQLDELNELKEEFEDVELELLAVLNAVIAAQTAELNRLNAELNNTYTVALNLYGLVYVLVFAAAVGITLQLSRSIARPIRELKDVTVRLAQRDYSQRANVKTSDEIGVLAQNFNAMASAIEERDRQLEQQVEEVKKSRDEAQRSSEVKSAFLASMSHELRTPLNAVINFTRFVIDGDTGPINEDQRELLTDVVNSARHLLNLINDVLDMSKIESGSLNLFIQDDVDVTALLKSAVSTGQSLLGDKPVEIHTEIGDNLPLVRADKLRILQILLNIISNAAKFTEEGDITVRAQRVDDEILVAVKDTGPGILPEDQPMVFEAFKQTPSGLRQAGGTGLGMPIARSLAEAHGGQVWLESKPGEGTTFYFSMPIRSHQLVPTQTQQAPAQKAALP